MAKTKKAEISPAHIAELYGKIKVIDDFSNCVVKHFPNVNQITYDVFIAKDGSEIQEFLVTHYIGGGKSVIPTNINSNAVNVRLAAETLISGKYDTLDRYKSFKNNKKFYQLLGITTGDHNE